MNMLDPESFVMDMHHPLAEFDEQGELLEDVVQQVKVRPRVVVCAANRYFGDTIVCGARHFDRVMGTVIDVLAANDIPVNDTSFAEEQGFIDQHGVFLTRQEAWQVAVAAKQVRYRVGGDTAKGGTLYSENLY